MRRQRGAGGFTLLEVLVALAVLAVGLGAVIRLAGSSADTAAELRARSIAAWVAENRINQLLLAPDWPSLGRSNGTALMARHRWAWQQSVSATADSALRRVDIVVTMVGSERQLSAQTAFVGRQ